jgi:hypothetical protein
MDNAPYAVKYTLEDLLENVNSPILKNTNVIQVQVSKAGELIQPESYCLVKLALGH